LKKFLLSLLCLALLCGCTVKVDTDNTESNISETTTEEQTTDDTATEPTAEAVAGVEAMSTQKVIWGPGNIVDHKQPSEPLQLQSNYFDLEARWLLSEEKSVCLTFDEGYENGFTPSILDTLKEKNVKAIFFVTYDFAASNSALIERMIKEGHIVGNHSYHHYAMDELDVSTAKEEVRFLHDYLKEKHNYTMSYFRFPKGEFSEQSLGILRDLGYTSVFWSFAYADWEPENQPDEAEALRHITESTHPGEIILLHAVSKTNADILGDAIDDIRKQGYEFTVDI
jgi:peptidoglycan-N-acetylmuramic acid deacetylase